MIKLLLVSILWGADGDSLRMETINGKQFIIHQIEAKETLYSISRRYGVAVTAIIESNGAAEGSLAVGQLLKIPFTPKAKANPGTEVAGVPAMKSVSSTHTVAAKETLYSVARQHGVSVEQLRQWNSLTSDELKPGQTLLVVQPKNANAAAALPVPVAAPVSPTNAAAGTIRISEKVLGADEVREEGGCDLMPNTENNRKYLALHRTAKTGAVLKVRNTQTNREVFVRVMGPMPADVSPDVLIRISSAAIKRLDATDGKCKVEVTYYK